MTESHAMHVERWDTHEIALEAAGRYENPFRDVDVTATFTHLERGKSIIVNGFYDGGRTWRVRLMPGALGTWEYRTHSADRGLDGQSGTLLCTAPHKAYLKGPLQARGYHFFHADGAPCFLISTRFSCQFADRAAWPPLIEFLQEHRINRVLFMTGGVNGSFKEFYGQNADGTNDFWRYNVERFQAVDAFIDALRQGGILAAPYLYYFNDGVQRGLSYEQDLAYVRYSMARFGAYANVMPVLSNEVEQKTTGRLDQYDLSCHTWANKIGPYLRDLAVFGLPVTVHDPMETMHAVKPSFYTLLYDWPFPWTSHMLRQAQLCALSVTPVISDEIPEQRWPITYSTRGYARHNQLLIDLRRFGIPVVNEEPGYEMKGHTADLQKIDPRPFNTQTTETLIPTFWGATCAGGYCMWGHMGTYITGDPLEMTRDSETPRMLQVLHECMAALPFWEMEPANDLVAENPETIDGVGYRTNFCLAKPGEAYLVFSRKGGSISLDLQLGVRYALTQLDPRSGERIRRGEVDGGKQSVSLTGEDQVLTAARVEAR
jgi:hypothetical protein